MTRRGMNIKRETRNIKRRRGKCYNISLLYLSEDSLKIWINIRQNTNKEGCYTWKEGRTIDYPLKVQQWTLAKAYLKTKIRSLIATWHIQNNDKNEDGGFYKAIVASQQPFPGPNTKVDQVVPATCDSEGIRKLMHSTTFTFYKKARFIQLHEMWIFTKVHKYIKYVILHKTN